MMSLAAVKKVGLLLPHDAGEQRAVALLAFTFATKEDSLALRDCDAALHPICGTAPKLPPKYLR
jgi:hypothetical protein